MRSSAGEERERGAPHARAETTDTAADASAGPAARRSPAVPGRMPGGGQPGAYHAGQPDHEHAPSRHTMRPSSAQPARPDHADHAEMHEPLGPDDPLAPLPFNPYKGNRGVTRAWHALKNSLAGFRVAIRVESAFRQELTLAAILLPIGLLVPVEPVARVLLLGSVLLVLIVELLNSSLEAAIDRISLERHELSRRAKDLGSAAVMVALFVCVMTWVLILAPLVGPLLARWLAALR
ncbi:diacylglycerol kinase [Paraburkholderia kururiensis]|uniref:diacylglycerol kinase n=1 Tax=Paraburkholderia kururiensis TaxID=984307 RepID=UPI003F71D00D